MIAPPTNVPHSSHSGRLRRLVATWQARPSQLSSGRAHGKHGPIEGLAILANVQFFFRETPAMQTVTFINHNPKYNNITRRDLRSINTHVNLHIATRTRGRTDDEAASLVSSSSLLSYQIGGLRTAPFGMLPIESRVLFRKL
jgi:hypothetical protein